MMSGGARLVSEALFLSTAMMQRRAGAGYGVLPYQRIFRARFRGLGVELLTLLKARVFPVLARNGLVAARGAGTYR